MRPHESYIVRMRAAVDAQDIDLIVLLLKDPEQPFWVRREGVYIVMDMADDVFTITIFNRLFLPINRVADEPTTQLLECWITREKGAKNAVRLTYLARFLFDAAGHAKLSDRIYKALLSLLAAWFQTPKSLANWSEAAPIVRRLLASQGDRAPERLLDPIILRAALWSGDLGLMRAYVDFGVKYARQPEHLEIIHFIMGILVSFGEKTSLLPLAEATHALDPKNVIAIHNLAQIRHALRHDLDSIADLFLAIDPSRSPGHLPGAIKWIAQVCYEFGLKEKAAALFELMPAPTSERGFSGRSWQQKTLQRQKGDGAIPPPSPPTSNMLELPGLSRLLRQPLEQAADLIRADMSWRSCLSAKDLEREFRRIVEAIDAVPRQAPLFEDCLRGAHRMVIFAKAYFEPHRHYFDVSPVPLEEKYGRMDFTRMRTAYLGMMAAAAATAELGLESVLNGAPAGKVQQCFQLMKHLVVARLAEGAPNRALPILRRLRNVGCCRDVATGFVELCCLAKGDVAAAEALLSPEEKQRCVIYRIVDRETWTRAEQLSWEVLFDDAESRGAFDVAWPDLGLIAYDHVVPAVRLALAQADHLTVRRGEVLRGREDTILRPARIHYPVAYPDRTPDIIAQGEGAVRLLRLARTVEIDEPVMVLENFDALNQRNWYHWLVLLLSRVNYLKDAGRLEGRRLIVPEGMSSWMNSSLQAVGVNAADMLVAPIDAELRLKDALLCSSIEWASPTLLKALADKLLPPTEARADGPPLHLFLSRRNQTRRPFLNENEIELIAEKLGFTIVQPETMTLQDQAKLFRRAASVVGSEGAAFANILFCSPGARVLTMLNESDLFPTFNDLATIMGLSHRKLTGKAELDDYGVTFLWAPFAIDPELAEREMRWAIGD